MSQPAARSSTRAAFSLCGSVLLIPLMPFSDMWRFAIKNIGERAHAIFQMAFHRLLRDAHAVGDFAPRQALNLAHDKGLARARRQFIDGITEAAQFIARL